MGKRNFGIFVLMLALILVFSGCGGGGGDGGGGTSSISRISGGVSKGPISGGTVAVYALNADGSKGSLLGTTTTLSDGRYSVNLGTYAGNVLVEATGGTYRDEATGNIVSNTMTLRAALTNVSGDVTVAVTPLTEIAVRYAGTLIKDNIDKGNAVVSSLVNLNITNTIPADVTSTTSQEKSQAEIDYGLMLASISQMVKDGRAISVSDAIDKIGTDLSDDGKLNDTGNALKTALTNFIANTNNQSGVTDLAQTGLDGAIEHYTANPAAPSGVNSLDLWKAKALVTDLRNTVLSCYNYDPERFAGVIDTPFRRVVDEFNTAPPFKKVQDEFNTKIEPELTDTVDRIGWIIESADTIPWGETGTYTFTDTDHGYTLTINCTFTTTNDLEINSADFTIKDSSNTTIDSGSLTVNADANGRVTSGTFNAQMKTTTGTLNANLAYTGTLDTDGYYDAMTLKGTMTAPDISYDFSNGGIYATFDPEPGAIDGSDVYPTSITYSGTITSTTAQMDGNLSISPIVWNTNAWENDGVCKAGPMPKSAILEGHLKEMADNSPTGVEFQGRLTLNWENAETYNSCIDDSATNFPQGNATFEGSLKITTARMSGTLKISNMVWNNNVDESHDGTVCEGAGVPELITFDGLFEEIKDGSPTGVKFTGKITGNWENAETYNACIDESDANFVKANATFDGRIEGTNRPTITTFLGVGKVGHGKYNLDASYRKINTDKTIVFLSGSGTRIEYPEPDSGDSQTQITATLSNQVGMKVRFTYNDSLPEDQRLTGTISTYGGERMADIYNLEGVPTVKYIDNYFESIF